MGKEYRGIIIKESFDNADEVLSGLLKTRIVDDYNYPERWHVYEVAASREEIERLGAHLIDQAYMHFWKAKEVIAVFAGNKVFEFNYDDKRTWKKMMQYSDFMEIPIREADFSIAGL